MLEALRIHARRGAYRHEIGCAGARIAEGPLANGGAKPVKEGVADIQSVKDALGAQIAIWQDRGWPILADDPGPALVDCFEGFVPADAPELSGPFRSGALERIEHSIRAVDPRFIVVDFDAQPSAGEGVLRISTYRDRTSIFHHHQHRASIRAIMWACCAYQGPLLRSACHLLLPVVLHATASAHAHPETAPSG